MKTVLFGLDGATYTVLDDLIGKGLMPNLAAFQRTGARAILESTPLPLTPQAWTSLATGRSAGHHGIHDFVRPVDSSKSLYYRLNDSRDNHCETIWKYASRHGKRVTVLNYFGTAPPQPINGHSMPAFIGARHMRRSCYPPDLVARLKDEIAGFEITSLGMDVAYEMQGLHDMDSSQWCSWIRQHLVRERIWFNVMEHLMATDPSDLTAIVFDGVDRVQHLAYRFLDPAFAPKNPTPFDTEVIAACTDYFKQIDDFLGRTIKRVGPWGRVFIASDHGFAGMREIVYINKWLHEKGWLSWRGDVAVDDQSAHFTERAVDLSNNIDIEHTKAYALTPSCNGIFIAVPPEEYHAFREELIRGLTQIKGPDGGQVITEIKKREEWFPGPFMNRIPDLTLTLRDFGFVSVLNGREILVQREHVAGTHHPHGILLGHGPGIKEGADAGLKNILDVASLLVHSLGLEIPAEYEGTFPASLYEPDYLASDPPRIARSAELADSSPAAHEPANGEVSEMDEADEANVLVRLRNLGYIE